MSEGSTGLRAFGAIFGGLSVGILVAGGAGGIAALIATLRSAEWLISEGRLSVAATYVIAELAVVVVCLGALRLSRVVRAQVASIFLSVVIGVYAANAFLTLKPFAAERVNMNEVAAARGHAADNRSRYRVVKELRDAGIDAVPHASPPNFYIHDRATGEISTAVRIGGQEALPLSMGVSNRRTVACNENGQWLTYDSDEYGFRNPRGSWATQPLDVVLLGDSFGYGSCEEDGNDIAGPVRLRFPGTLNLSASGGGGLSMLAYLNEYLVHLRPRHVVWLFFEGNDMQNIAEDLRMPLLRRYMDDPAFAIGLMDHQAEIDEAALELVARFLAAGDSAPPASRWRSLLFLGPLRKALDLPPLTAVWTRPKEDDLRLPELERALQRMKAGVEAWGGQLHLVYLPAWYRGRDRDQTLPIYVKTHEGVRSIAAANGINFVDLIPVFEADSAPQRLVSYPRSHYNDRGYRLVANAILKELGASAP